MNDPDVRLDPVPAFRRMLTAWALLNHEPTDRDCVDKVEAAVVGFCAPYVTVSMMHVDGAVLGFQIVAIPRRPFVVASLATQSPVCDARAFDVWAVAVVIQCDVKIE